MTIRMAKLERTSSGTWRSRKVIPADVREAYGKREEKPTWPATLTSVEARAAFGEWLGRVEKRIANLRQLQRAETITLSEKQIRALAGRWYHALVAEHGDNPGDPVGWEMAQEAIQPDEDADSWARYMAGDQSPDERPLKSTKQMIEERDRLLEEQRLRVDAGTADRLLRDMLDLYWRFCDLMIRRARGDYGGDPLTSTLPEWAPAETRQEPMKVSATAVSLLSLFDGYVAERKPAAATVKAWRRQLKRFIEHLGHDDAQRVTRADVVAWKDKLVRTPGRGGKPKSARTIQDTYLAGLKTILAWGAANGVIENNPAEGVKVAARKSIKLREKGFTDEEALKILSATLQEPNEQLSEERRRARRWVPWLCAYSGARVNEITQLRGVDISQDGGVWVLRITPEAGSVKTGEARIVPIHSHVIEQGFIDEALKWGDGPLFYDPKRHRGGSDGNPQYKKVGEFLARWVRSLGVDDPNVAPNHGWRHRFKTLAREAKLDPEAREYLAGHRPRTEGEAYGGWTPKALMPEIEKLPRYPLACAAEAITPILPWAAEPGHNEENRG